MLTFHEIIISWDGKGHWADNIWIERIWRTIKCESVHLAGVESLLKLKIELSAYISYYNNKRLHSSIGYKQPARYYENSINENRNEDYLVYCKLDINAVKSKDDA